MDIRRVGALVCLLSSGVGCSDLAGSGADPANDAGSSERASGVPAPVRENENARAVVEAVRGRFQQRMEAADATDALAAPAAPVPVLGPPSSARFERAGGFLRPVFDQAGPATVDLPVSAARGFRLRAASSGATVEARLEGARDVAAEVADGYVTYPGALSGGGALVHRVTEEGTEDYLVLEQRPERPSVSYSIALSDEVAGLRLVENTLEFVDVTGNPELRVSEPYLVGAKGERVEARLEVHDCEVDRDPAAPWQRPTVDPGARECELVVSWNDEGLSYPALLDPPWSATGNMAAARSNHAATLLGNGQVLVTGGWSGTGMRTSAEIYNPTTRTWASTAAMSTGRMDHTATLLSNGRVFVAGGGSGTTGTASCQIYDPTAGTWSTAASLPSARFRHSAIMTGLNLMVVGGTTGTETHPNSRIYNPSTNTWSSSLPMVNGQERLTLTRFTTGQGTIVAVGLNAPSAQAFNESTQVWTALPAQPAVARRSHVAVSTHRGLMIAGGVDATGATIGSAEVFNATTGTWQRTGSMKFPRALHSINDAGFIEAAIAREFIVTGDSSALGGGGTERWNSRFGTWEPGEPLGTPRFSHATVNLLNGNVLVTGGTRPGTTTVLSSAEDHDPRQLTPGAREYKLPAGLDTTVLSDLPIELWASVHTPTPLASGTRYPVILMLHGNHGSCGRSGTVPRQDFGSDYTRTGSCPAGSFVVSSHAGYHYIAGELAQRGYIVVSINAHRGITPRNDGPDPGDSALIQARGRLVLRHLQLLSEWNRGVRTPPAAFADLVGKLDLGQVGMMGHSRGGAGVRAAYKLYREAGSPWPGRIVDPVNFRGIFEIGPTDNFTNGAYINADSAKWGVLLPMCDGDVNNLDGVRAFDRMVSQLTEATPSFKATYTVWGANHNFYNTEWQEFDPLVGCFGAGNRAIYENSTGFLGVGSEEQRQTGFLAMLQFFRANVGSTDANQNQLFDPRFASTFHRVDRGYHPGSSTALSRQLEDFTNPTGTSSLGFANTASNVTVTHGQIPEHDNAHDGGTISWSTASSSNFFQTNFANPGSGINLSSYQFLDLRVDRARDNALNTAATTDFGVVLVNGNGTVTGGPRISTYLKLEGPVGRVSNATHSMLQTARIPLSVFGNATLSSIRGVRLVFSATASGKIYVANIRATTGGAPGTPLAALAAAPATASASLAPTAARTAAPGTRVISGSVVSIETKDAATLRIRLRSPTAFQERDAQPVLSIGSERSLHSSHPNGPGEIVFQLSRQAFDRLRGGEPITLQYGETGTPTEQWNFGTLDKALLK